MRPSEGDPQEAAWAIGACGITTRQVTLTMEDRVAVVSLSDSRRRNVIDPQSSRQLAEAIQQGLDEDARALVLRAEPPVFCAGGSLDDLLNLDVDLGPLYQGFLALASAPIPTVAAIDGACIGAGLNLPLCCDVVLTTPQARFDPRFLDVGIHPGGGHLWRLSRRVGTQGAAALVLFGDTLDGIEAVEHGLAWRCVEPLELLPRAMALARRAADRPAELVRRTKQTLRASATSQGEHEAVAMEAEAQRWSRLQPGFVERVRAIKERRP
jgi:enoyl-CoA hydratase